MSVVVAIYGFVDVVLLLAAALVDRAKALLHALGIRRNLETRESPRNGDIGIYGLGELVMRRTKMNAKGQITIPVELREKLGIEKALGLP